MYAEIRLRREIAAAFLFSGGVSMEQTKQTLNPSEQMILDMLRSLDYGEVLITIHNGKPTMMEVSKKIKF